MADYKKGNSGYGKKPTGGKKPYGKREFDDRKPYGKGGDDRKPYGKREFDDRKPYGKSDDRKPYGKREFDDRKPYGKSDDRKPYGKREFDDRKPYGKREFDDRKPYGKSDDRKPYGKGGDDRKPYGKREFDDRKPYGKREFDDRKPYGKREFDDRKPYERRDYSDSVSTMREDELPFLIMGRNAVREAIKSGRSIDKILIVADRDGSLGEIVSLARDRNILIQEEKRERLDEICMPFGHGDKPGNHQGVVARVPGAEYVEISDILAYAKEKNEQPFVLLLDGITDPYNFGSIIRSAECAGVHGIIIPKRRSATLTSAVVKVAQGAASHMRVAKVANIATAIDTLKENGLWIAGTDMDGDSMYSTNLKGAMALVIGSEEDGISELVRKKCDYVVSAPIKGHIDSLNAAVAAAVVMFEKIRQDGIEE